MGIYTRKADTSRPGFAVISKSQIYRSWRDHSGNETGLRIERCKGSPCINFALIATIYANTNFTANTTWRCRVYAASGNNVKAINKAAELRVVEPAAGLPIASFPGKDQQRSPIGVLLISIPPSRQQSGFIKQ